MTEIHQFNHAAMATLSGADRSPRSTYAAQAAQAAFDLLNLLETRLSRFRSNSDIARLAHLCPAKKCA